MLEVEAVQAKGRHAPLIERTSFTVEVGELILVQGNSQLQRSGLSLALTGRLRPDKGTISWDGSDKRKTLRRRSSLIDSPRVNQMEEHMRVRDYAAEMLSYMPHNLLSIHQLLRVRLRVIGWRGIHPRRGRDGRCILGH